VSVYEVTHGEKQLSKIAVILMSEYLAKNGSLTLVLALFIIQLFD